jgi:integrase/recombinase XerD
MLSLLEHTGARRLEIAGLTIDDIKAAKALAEPMLRLETLKRGGKSERFIPISKVVLSEANKYIETARKKSMRSFKGGQDHRALFVQEITGKKLSEHSITREVSILRKHAKIEQQACAHMFRHAFITNLFVLLIKRYNFSNTSEFRNAFLHSKQFIAEVMLWTGHKNPASVERYIHLAFAQIDGYEETVSSVHMIRINRIYDQAEAELLEKLVGGMPASQYALALGEMKRLRKEDLQHVQIQEQANEAAEAASLEL